MAARLEAPRAGSLCSASSSPWTRGLRPRPRRVTDTTALRDVRDYLEYVRRQTARLRADGASPDDAAAAIEKDARAPWTTWDYPYWISLAVRALYQAGSSEGVAT